MSNIVPADPDGFALVICSCDGGPYLGARKAGTPCCCEACGYMTREAIDAVLLAATPPTTVPASGAGAEGDVAGEGSA